MSGTKPAHVVVRDFRGQRLYLAQLYTGRGGRWLADESKALKLPAEEALMACEAASRDWGAKCAVLDTSGTLATREPVSNEIAAANCRAILAQLSVDGKVNYKAFIGEMQSRSLEQYGKPLHGGQLRLLAKIVAAYEAEQKS